MPSEERDTLLSCTLCGAAPVRHLFDKQEIPYHACPRCEFVFSTPAANANLENALEDYEPAYLGYLDASPEDDVNHAALLHWAEGACSVRDGPALDVGAGSGKFVRFLRGQGVEAYGLEPAAPLFARFLCDEAFFSQKTLEDFTREPAPETFRSVFACDVLEHVAGPRSFLAAAGRLLAPGGALLVSTPDVGSTFARLLGKRWHYFNKYHLSYFSRATLAAAAARHGLREVSFARLPRSKSVGYLLQYTLDFVLGGGRARLPESLLRLSLPVNLFDTMYVAFERR